jgi:biotin carboxyl carrier protein
MATAWGVAHGNVTHSSENGAQSWERNAAMKTTLHYNGALLTLEYEQQGNEFAVRVAEQIMNLRLLSVQQDALTFLVNEKPLRAHVVHDGQRTLVAIEGHVYKFSQAREKQGKTSRKETGRLEPEIRSPMPGKILQVLVQEGAQVEAGQTLVLVEAMKMENALTAEGAAHVKKIHVAPGDLVDLGQVLIELEFRPIREAAAQDS